MLGTVYGASTREKFAYGGDQHQNKWMYKVLKWEGEEDPLNINLICSILPSWSTLLVTEIWLSTT